VLLALGAGAAWWLWQAAPGADPAAALGPVRAVFANGFYLDAVQDRAIVRPVRALAALIRTMDEGVVDGAVDGTGESTTRLGARLAAVHRTALPWAATAVFTGALLLGLAAAIYRVAT
jgi:NADH-quinone oxidoreductase subunit L